ncbi:MAG: GNAT family N-acetyltransferase [Alistipes sp.]|nr:GNAT family N-acetyltransferase [Alistipes sp.]
MRAPKITIRSARVEDAATIACAVAMAIGDKEALRAYCGNDYMAVLTQIAATKGTQYSWQYALVAEVDGTAAGAVVGYDGDDLQPLREGTFAIVRQLTGRVPNIANETEGGEYYLDSVGVLPEFRGLNVGRTLVREFCNKVFATQHNCVGLIVDSNNPQAEKLYTSLGFERVGTRLFFGHRMWHLQLRDNKL